MMRLMSASLAAGLSLLATQALADPCRAIAHHRPMPKYLQPGSTISGPVPHVVSGDTLCVAIGPNPSQWVKVQLANIRPKPPGDGTADVARSVLRRVTRRQGLTCTIDRQSGDRVVARCAIHGEDVADRVRDVSASQTSRRP